jgi:hypothetical protein
MIRALVGSGAKLDAVDKDNQTPLIAAEKLLKSPPDTPSVMGDPGAYKRPKDSREAVVAALRELMHLGPNDPTPQPPPAPAKDEKAAKDEKKVSQNKDAKKAPEAEAVTNEQ